MRRVRFSLRTIHSESQEPTLELADGEEVLNVTAGLVGGHPTYEVVTARTLDDTASKGQEVPDDHHD